MSEQSTTSETTQQQTTDQGQAQTNTAPATFEDYFAKLDEPTKGLIDSHTKGLKSALEAERGKAGELDKQLKALEKSLKEGSEERAQVETLRKQLADAQLQNTFMDAAVAAGARNVKRLFTLAKAEGAIDAKGEFDVAKLKTDYPEYFAPPVQQKANTDSEQRGNGDLNVDLKAMANKYGIRQ